MAKAATRVNYTEEMTAKIVSDYAAGVTVETIAAEIGKTVRSVRAKLVREGVYIAPEKPVKAEKDLGPTKKELMIELVALWPEAPVDGLVNVTKDALTALIEFVQDSHAEAMGEAA